MFLPNVVKIDPYNCELYCFKVGAFMRQPTIKESRMHIAVACGHGPSLFILYLALILFVIYFLYFVHLLY